MVLPLQIFIKIKLQKQLFGMIINYIVFDNSTYIKPPLSTNIYLPLEKGS